MNPFIETLNQWGGKFSGFAWPMFWQSSLLIAILFASDFVFRRKIRASIRYALWLVVLVKLLVPPTLALPTSPAWWLHKTTPPVAVQTEPAHFTVTYDNAPLPEIPQPPPPAITPPKPAMNFASWLLVVSAAVSSALLGWLLVRWWQIAGQVRRAASSERMTGIAVEAQRIAGMKFNMQVKLTTNSMSPAVCGLFRPAILIPQSLADNFSDGQLRAVLLHELIHLRRRDVWVNFLQALLQIFYWWHPLVWLANAHIRRVREEAVDDAVMLALRDEADNYAPTLLEVAKLALNRPLASLGLVGILESRHALRQRIERLVDFRAPRHAGLTLVSLLGILAFTAVAVPMGEGPTQTNNPALPVVSDNLSQTNSSVSKTGDVSSSTNAVQNSIMVTFKVNGSLDEDSLKKLFQDGGMEIPPTIFFYKDNGMLVVRGSKEQLALVNRAVLKANGFSPKEIEANDKQFLNDKLPIGVEDSTNLFERTFKVGTLTFISALQKNTGLQTTNVSTMARIFFSKLGVDWESPAGKSVFYNDRLGLLFVRATNPDLDTIEHTILALNQVASQNHSVATNSAENKLEADRLVQDAKQDYEMGKLDEAEAKLKMILALDSSNQAAYYYLDLVDKARLAPKQPPLMILTNWDISPIPIKKIDAHDKQFDQRISTIGLEDSAATNLFTRTFKVDPNTFYAVFQNATGLQTNDVSKMARIFFSKLGVDLDSPKGKSVIFNDRLGLLFVRATESDLDAIERAISALNQVPPQIHIKARFVEVTQEDNKSPDYEAYLGQFSVSNNVAGNGGGSPSPAMPVSAANPLGSFPGNTTSSTGGLQNSAPAMASLTGILTDPDFRAVLHALQQRSGSETFGEPEGTTTSGRRTIIKATEIITVITNFTYQETATNSGVSPQMEKLEVGPVLDSTAWVLSDGYTIDLSIKASYSEFLGYDKPTNTTATVYTKGGVKIDVPVILPRIEVRQASTHVNVWDGQTVVLGGMIIPSIQTIKDKVPLLGDLPGVGRFFQSQSKTEIKKKIMVFVTATIVDAAGNRIHTDDEMPFAKDKVPVQVIGIPPK